VLANQHESALAAFQQSRQLLDGLALPHLSIEAVAWLGQTALRQGKGQQALEYINQVLAHLDEHAQLHGTEDPLQIRWTCCEVLRAQGDPRLGAVLENTWVALQARLAALKSASTKDRFMTSRPHHGEIARLAVEAGLVLEGR